MKLGQRKDNDNGIKQKDAFNCREPPLRRWEGRWEISNIWISFWLITLHDLLQRNATQNNCMIMRRNTSWTFTMCQAVFGANTTLNRTTVPLLGERINTLHYIQTIELYSGGKKEKERNELSSQAIKRYRETWNACVCVRGKAAMWLQSINWDIPF